jgi:hypothetical protein
MVRRKTERSRNKYKKKVSRNKYTKARSKKGYTKKGYTKKGYTKKGYTKKGYTKKGYTKKGYTKRELALQKGGDGGVVTASVIALAAGLMVGRWTLKKGKAAILKASAKLRIEPTEDMVENANRALEMKMNQIKEDDSDGYDSTEEGEDPQKAALQQKKREETNKAREAKRDKLRFKHDTSNTVLNPLAAAAVVSAP